MTVGVQHPPPSELSGLSTPAPRELARADSISLGVLVVSSRERVLVSWARSRGLEPPAALSNITRNEEALTARILEDHLDFLEILHIDALTTYRHPPWSRLCERLYPLGADGRPLPRGMKRKPRRDEARQLRSPDSGTLTFLTHTHIQPQTE